MIKRIGQIALVLLLGVVLAAAGLFAWGQSDPDGCVAGEDPAVELANKRAGTPAYSDWCHEFAGNRLHVVEAGEGEVVLFIHGFPTIWYSMIRPMEAMRGDYRVVAIDGLGAGLSDAPADVGQYRLANMAEHIDALIAELGAEKVHLVGHDWGAAFVGAYAQSRPESVASVTIMSAPPQNVAVEMLSVSERQRQISEYVERLKSANPPLALLSGAGARIAAGPKNHFEAGRLSQEEAEVLQAATSDLRRVNRHINWYRANLPAPDAITEADYWPNREVKIEVPALLIWGEDDTVFDPAFIHLMQAADPDLLIVRLEGVGHAPQFEASEEVNRRLHEHIERSRLTSTE